MKLKRFCRAITLAAGAGALLLIIGLTACGADASIRAIHQNGALRVGYASCAPSEDAPFVMADSKGLTAEPAARAAKAFDVPPEFTRLSAGEAYAKLLDGSVDCLWNVTPPDKDTVAAVRTVETGIYYRQLVMVPESSKITRLADVSGKVMAVVSGSDAQTELHRARVMEKSLKSVRVYGSMEEVLTALTEGEAQCAAVDEPQALYAASKREDAAFRFVETPIAENSLVIATRAEDGAVCERIAEQYVKMAQNGDIRTLCKTYASEEMTNSLLVDGGTRSA